jgi:predicted GH43/DUF377 family glycosyl hydrolase
MSSLNLKRMGVLMTPEPGNPHEVEGVLNPAVTRGHDGNLYLFPRLVGKGNFSRVGIARVQFDSAGDPCGVERLGIALEPKEPYELRPGGGGCEDPRVSYVEAYKHYTMNYVALGPNGPRIAQAISEDLIHWRRLGLVTFEPYDHIEFTGVDNKDSCLFSRDVPSPSGEPSLSILHRPLFPGTRPEEKATSDAQGVQDVHRESIWMSYRALNLNTGAPFRHSHFTSHHLLAAPEADWEQLKIGVGAPPVLCRHGWLVIYHGVSDVQEPGVEGHNFRYSAGLMILDRHDPTKILYRSLSRFSRLNHRKSGPDSSQTSFSPPASIGETTWECRIVSTCTTAWPTTESGSRDWTCRKKCRRVDVRPSPRRPSQSCSRGRPVPS